jgi:predicted nuclease with TOPRIM domain
MRLQIHLRFCAENVQTEQTLLITRMKEVDTRSNAVQQRLTDKQKRFTGYCEQSKKLRDVATSLKRLDQSLSELADRMRAINLCLPPDDQLSTLAFRNKPTAPSS